MAKTDRLARLLRLERILYQHANGLSAVDLAERCGVSRRTIYRDIEALDTWVHVPIWQEGGKFGIQEGHYLPPIRFSLTEALSIFLASRLMLRFANRYDPSIASTFEKLNTVVPAPLRDHVERTLEWMSKLRMEEHQLHVLRVLAESWLNHRTVRISYHTLGAAEPVERCIDTYFIEPAAKGHSSYVIGHCHLKNETRFFKVDRILAIEMTDGHYRTPAEFDADRLLASSWGIIAEGHPGTVKLRFDRAVARIIEEVVWHPSQVVERQGDGSAVMTLNVRSDPEFKSWVLSWGDQVEVLQPEALRLDIARTAEAMAKRHRQYRMQVNTPRNQ